MAYVMDTQVEKKKTIDDVPIIREYSIMFAGSASREAGRVLD